MHVYVICIYVHMMSVCKLHIPDLSDMVLPDTHPVLVYRSSFPVFLITTATTTEGALALRGVDGCMDGYSIKMQLIPWMNKSQTRRAVFGEPGLFPQGVLMHIQLLFTGLFTTWLIPTLVHIPKCLIASPDLHCFTAYFEFPGCPSEPRSTSAPCPQLCGTTRASSSPAAMRSTPSLQCQM